MNFPFTSFVMSSKLLHRNDTLVEHYSHHEDEHGKIQLQRIVVVSIDPGSADYVVNWAVDNYIRSESDLVRVCFEFLKAKAITCC